MGVDTTMFACFEGHLTKAQVKSFGAWHDEQFDDCGFFSTPTAHRHERFSIGRAVASSARRDSR